MQALMPHLSDGSQTTRGFTLRRGDGRCRCLKGVTGTTKERRHRMSPVIFTPAAKVAMDKLKRVCPKCKKEQYVPGDKVSETVKCASCGANMPPKK